MSLHEHAPPTSLRYRRAQNHEMVVAGSVGAVPSCGHQRSPPRALVAPGIAGRWAARRTDRGGRAWRGDELRRDWLPKIGWHSGSRLAPQLPGSWFPGRVRNPGQRSAGASEIPGWATPHRRRRTARVGGRPLDTWAWLAARYYLRPRRSPVPAADGGALVLAADSDDPPEHSAAPAAPALMVPLFWGVMLRAFG